MKTLMTLGMGILAATLLSHTATAGAIILFQDDFNGASLDTSKWNVHTSDTANTVKLTGGGELEIDLNYERFDGVQVSIPEPAALALLALGGLALLRRRRN